MNRWQILGISPTRDRKSIKKAYIRLIKQYHPEDHPEKFQEIRDAYEAALDWAAAGEADKVPSQADAPDLSTEDPLIVSPHGGNPPPGSLNIVDATPEEIAALDENTPHGIDELGGPGRTPDHKYNTLIDPADVDDHETLIQRAEERIPDDSRPVCLDEIERYLADNRQKEACEIFQQLLGQMRSLADRVSFGKGLIRLLAHLPIVPMVFTEYVVDRLNWDVQAKHDLAGPDRGATDVMDVYWSVRNLKRAMAKGPASKLKTLKTKQSGLWITLQAFSAKRRKFILQWIDALSPYADYHDYLGVDTAALSAWQDELRRPQYPPGPKDYVTALFLSTGYAYYAATPLAWPLWAKWGIGLVFWLLISMLMAHLPVVRWAGYKWREDWRPNASNKLVKSALDIIPLGIIFAFGAISHYCFPSIDNPATYSLFLFLVFLLGVGSFGLLAIITSLFIVLYSRDAPDANIILLWVVVFAFWLKIKLTLMDNGSMEGKTAGRIGYLIIAAACTLILHQKWHLPF